MKTLKFDKDSWHYKLANFGGVWYIEENICGYTRQVIRGAFLAMLVLCVVEFFLFLCVASLLIVLISYIENGIFFIDSPIYVAFISGVTIDIVVLFGYLNIEFQIQDKIKEKLFTSNDNKKKSNFIVEGYRAFKEKTCVRIEFSGGE